jgi:hypothetical protein
MCGAVLLQISQNLAVTGLIRSRAMRRGLPSGTEERPWMKIA